jgi:hypothetical protein
LAAVAGHAEAHAQGRLMFEAAADQFTPDHSPLDWAAIQMMRAADDPLPLMILNQAEALTQGQGLIIGALARERRLARETALAESLHDTAALDVLEARLRARMARAAPLDWAADQIGMAAVALARQRLGGPPPKDMGLILAEAAATANEWGAPALADRAERLRRPA